VSTLETDVGDIRPVAVAFTTDELVVILADGRKIGTPLAWYPRPETRALLPAVSSG